MADRLSPTAITTQEHEALLRQLTALQAHMDALKLRNKQLKEALGDLPGARRTHCQPHSAAFRPHSASVSTASLHAFVLPCPCRQEGGLDATVVQGRHPRLAARRSTRGTKSSTQARTQSSTQGIA